MNLRTHRTKPSQGQIGETLMALQIEVQINQISHASERKMRNKTIRDYPILKMQAKAKSM